VSAHTLTHTADLGDLLYNQEFNQESIMYRGETEQEDKIFKIKGLNSAEAGAAL
jgi:hypothetical protein